MFPAALTALLLAQSAPEPLVYRIDATRPAPISPYIYGHNHADPKTAGWTPALLRSGGNRMTAYNWETNASNAGSDWQHQNDAFLGGGDTPGEVVRTGLAAARDLRAACVVTVPLIGRVAADKKGGGDVRQSPDYLRTRFLPSLPKKDGPFADVPDLTDGKVYQDEFVAWVEKRPSGPPVFYSLDNEPELWSSTHARLHPEKVRFDELVRLNAEYGEAVKRVAPKALVFGFVSYGWHGLTTLQDAPDRRGRDFTDVYLQEMAAAEKRAGRRLVDVLDIHWYPEARGGNVRVTEDASGPDTAAARIQSPRSLWDASYREDSWIAGAAGGPVRLLPRLQEKIAAQYPGTKLALTEYYYGGGGHISGALAQADVLGILGREGVFAAALWHLGRTDDRFIHAACAMFRNFDGRGGAFGDTGWPVEGGDPSRASVYASVDAQGRGILVALNKTGGPLPLRIGLQGAPVYRTAAIYRLTAAEAKPAPVAAPAALDGATLSLELPALSVSTILLRP
jgi:hypothetical protein